MVRRHGDLIIPDLRFLGNVLRVIVASGLVVVLVPDGGEQHGDGDVLAHLKLILLLLLLQGSAKRLRDCCRQAQAEVGSNSRNKIHPTWPKPFSHAL